ncbi:hypothetical protein HDU81_005303 [Chytriomyces hyalinus]|nr:hypothetical protein HDU81_005303 [Chytriomyces hyalinus]
MLSDDSSSFTAEPSTIKTSEFSCKWTCCPHTFTSTHDLQIHLTHDHIATSTVCKCQWQGCLQSSKTFSRKNSLVNHAKTHACVSTSSIATSPSMPLTRSTNRRSFSMTDVPHSNSLPTTSTSSLMSSPLARSSSLVVRPGRSRKRLSIEELVDPSPLASRLPSSTPVQQSSPGRRDIQHVQQPFLTATPKKKLATILPDMGLRGDVIAEGVSKLPAPARVENAAAACAFRNMARELGTGLSDVFGDICGEFRENEFGEKADPTDLF